MKNKKAEIDPIIENRSYNIVKHNDLIQKSRFNLSMQEQKIILYLISKIKPEDEEFKLYEFKIKDFCEICGIDETSGGNYFMLKKIIKSLSDKNNSVTIIKNGENLDTNLRWIEKYYMNRKSGTIKIRLDEDMKPYLLKLKQKFTTYSLYWVLAMKSKYSIRLYELLKSYLNLKEYDFEIDALKMLMSAEKYETFDTFKRRVLDTSIREINDYSDLYVTYELEKQGKKFHKIKFIMKLNFDGSLETVKRIEKILNS